MQGWQRAPEEVEQRRRQLPARQLAVPDEHGDAAARQLQQRHAALAARAAKVWAPLQVDRDQRIAHGGPQRRQGAWQLRCGFHDVHGDATRQGKGACIAAAAGLLRISWRFDRVAAARLCHQAGPVAQRQRHRHAAPLGVLPKQAATKGACQLRHCTQLAASIAYAAMPIVRKKQLRILEATPAAAVWRGAGRHGDALALL
jgi:hypothetical protein